MSKAAPKKFVRRTNANKDPNAPEIEEKKYYLTQEDKKDLRIKYDQVDINKDQQLNIGELQKLFILIRRELSDKEIEDWLLSLGKKTCSFEDFIYLEQELLKKNQIKDEAGGALNAFKDYDTECKGYLNCEEMKKLLMENGDKFSQEEIEKLYQYAQIKEDGIFCYEKFLTKLIHI